MYIYRSIRKRQGRLLLFHLVLLGLLYAYPTIGSPGYTLETVPNVRLTDKTNHVSDPDHILGRSDIAAINRQLNLLEDSLSIEVAVVALPSIGDADARTFATDLFNRWGLGKKGEDNGLLILFVTDQRAVVFETGYGLEGVFPDAISYRIQQRDMIPDLKAGRYSAGILSGVNGVTRYLLENVSANGSKLSRTAPPAGTEHSGTLGLLYLALSLVVAIWYMRKIVTVRRRYPDDTAVEVLQEADRIFRQPGCVTVLLFLPGILVLAVWYFFYRKILVSRARTCPNCGRKHFHALSAQEGAPLLDSREQMENQLESACHTAYRCDDCGYTCKNTVDNPGSPYKTCPNCGTKAYSCSDSHIIRQPTYLANGLAEETCSCKMCNYTDHHKKLLKPLRRNTLAGGIGGGIGGMIGGGFFGGGGGTGGGFGGGSWGGGASGGGGSISRF